MAPEDDGATKPEREIIQTNRLSCRNTCPSLWPCHWHGLPHPGPLQQERFISPGAEAANQADPRGVVGGLSAGPVAWSWKWSRRISMKKFWLSLGLGLILACWWGGRFWNRYRFRTVLRSSRAATTVLATCRATPGTLLVTGTIMPHHMRTHFPNFSIMSLHR